MAKMIFDDEGLLEEPCLSCDKAYIEDIWNEWCCDERECTRQKGGKWNSPKGGKKWQGNIEE